MSNPDLKYKVKTATAEEINGHLIKCNDNFLPPLNKKVSIEEYSKKLFEKSVTFEAWSGNLLAGLVAAYFNDKENFAGFISNVSVLPEYSGKGIASVLLEHCNKYAAKKGFKEIKLEVSQENYPAIHLYKKSGYNEIEKKDNLVIMKIETGNK